MPEEKPSGAEAPITFTLAGAKRCVPIAIGGCSIGLVFGTMAGRAALMCALAFSGAAQFVE